MAQFGSGRRFHDLKCFEVEIFIYLLHFYHIPWIHYKLDGTITIFFVENINLM